MGEKREITRKTKFEAREGSDIMFTLVIKNIVLFTYLNGSKPLWIRQDKEPSLL